MVEYIDTMEEETTIFASSLTPGNCGVLIVAAGTGEFKASISKNGPWSTSSSR